MAFDVFALRDQVVGEYHDYFESFVNIRDQEIDSFVRARLHDGELWPAAVLQLNPAYQPGPTLQELAARGAIAQETARFFGPGLPLYHHQEEALEIARRGEPYVVSTGTGSGKSLTYLVPIFDHIIRHQPQRHSVRAIVVYPMNALVNSQLEALERFRQQNWPDCPVRFHRYTGQERGEARQRILNDPPHLLLTNYVMLEYILIRPHERPLVRQATRELQFLVTDELHVYRGRQGADVAMLMRRLRQRAGNPTLQFVGTSATLVTRGSRQERRERIAEAASTLFGVSVPAGNVVGETLRRMATVPAPATPQALRAAVEMPLPQPTLVAVAAHPLAAWIEETFGIRTVESRLARQEPVTFKQGLLSLVAGTGLDEGLCRERLKAVLEAGNSVRTPSGDPYFAFRLHQFLSSGSSVFATIESGQRTLTTEGQYAAPADGPDGSRKLLYPLAFCRECGQEYYLVSLVQEGSQARLEPRSPLLNASEEDSPGTDGFFSPETGDLWTEDEDLPESWFEQRRSGPRAKERYGKHIPRRAWVLPDGTFSFNRTEGAVEGWFQPRPLMLCLRCRAAYDLRDSDFRKLATLSQTGRSTSTTIVTASAVTALGHQEREDPSGNKVLSFTDNRQDASLQAGHLNDFVQVVLLRGALVKALGIGARGQGPGAGQLDTDPRPPTPDPQPPFLTFDRLGATIFEGLNLLPQQFMKEAVPSGSGFNSARQVMVDMLEYRAFEDLRRAWRVAQPNLEQCGLLRIEYEGLSELAADASLWAGVEPPGAPRLPFRPRSLPPVSLRLGDGGGPLSKPGGGVGSSHSISSQRPPPDGTALAGRGIRSADHLGGPPLADWGWDGPGSRSRSFQVPPPSATGCGADPAELLLRPSLSGQSRPHGGPYRSRAYRAGGHRGSNQEGGGFQEGRVEEPLLLPDHGVGSGHRRS